MRGMQCGGTEVKTPTNDDLKRLVDEARVEHERCGEAPGEAHDMANRAILTMRLALIAMTSSGTFWRDTRVLCLRAAYLCLLAAWEAGRRMVPSSYDRVMIGGKPFPPDPTSAETPEAKAPDVEALTSDDATDPRAIRESAVGRAFSSAANEVIGGLAAALRAERERHLDTARALGESVADTGEAIGAQNRAESERDGLRSDLLEATRAKDEAERERGAAFDMATKWRGESLDLRATLQAREQRIGALEKGIRGLAAHVPAKGDA
jgi:hypothetical protein